MSGFIIDHEKVLEAERAVLATLRSLGQVERPAPGPIVDARASFGERVADRVAETAGSWTFIALFSAGLAAWIAWNAWRGGAAVDPFPFILLNLMLSCVAALQAPVIMMSQNRQTMRDRLHADLDYQINVKAEREIEELRIELEELRRQKWTSLIALQGEQIALLREIAHGRRAGGEPTAAPPPPG